MADSEVKVIVKKDWNWKRPNSSHSFRFRPSDKPVAKPRDAAKAAVAAGVAKYADKGEKSKPETTAKAD